MNNILLSLINNNYRDTFMYIIHDIYIKLMRDVRQDV